MLLSKQTKASEALKLGLLDATVPGKEQLLPAACALALDMAGGRRPRLRTLFRSDKLEGIHEALQVGGGNKKCVFYSVAGFLYFYPFPMGKIKIGSLNLCKKVVTSFTQIKKTDPLFFIFFSV